MSSDASQVDLYFEKALHFTKYSVLWKMYETQSFSELRQLVNKAIQKTWRDENSVVFVCLPRLLLVSQLTGTSYTLDDFLLFGIRCFL